MSTLDQDDFDRAFRPLVAASLGLGVMALGVLQFAGQSWGTFGDEARVLSATAARTAFLSFIMVLGATLFAFMFRRALGGVLRAIVNAYGVAVFLVGSFLCAGLCSRAMFLETSGSDEPPDQIAAFLGLAGVSFIVIAILMLAIGVWRVIFRGHGSERAKS